MAKLASECLEVYILTHGADYGADYVIGAYESREDAENEGERLIKGRRFTHYDITVCDFERRRKSTPDL